MQTDIFLVRHGEPVLTNALLGSTDSPVSELGWQQLEATLNNIPGLEQLVSSPLSRCANFAQHFAAEKSLPLQIDNEWRECHFGDWDGQKYQDLHQSFPEAVEEFFSDPYKCMPPNGESLKVFNSRIENAVKVVHERFAGKKIAVITHAGVIRTLVAWCLKMDYRSGLQFRRFALDYASVTHLSLYYDEKIYPQLICLNQNSTNKVFGSPLSETSINTESGKCNA